MTDELYVYLDQTFEWDLMKAARNAVKHRVRFTEAATVLFDEEALFEADPEHSDGEDRYIVLGRSIRTKCTLGGTYDPRRVDTPDQRQNGNTERKETL